MTTVTVRAVEPTVLHNRTHYELLPTDLMLGARVDVAYIVPGPIDVERFQAALAATLAVYPLATGRLERPHDTSQRWKVRLSNDGVPLTIIESDAEQEVPVDTIVQSPWTLSEVVDLARLLDHKSEEPLLRVTLIRFRKTESTSIGCSSAHIIGDGFTVARFMRLLSQHYQCLPPLDPAPSYDPLIACHDGIDQGMISTTDIDYPYTASKEISSLETSPTESTRVNFRLTASQIARIYESALAQGHEKYRTDHVGDISRQDTLLGLLAICISRADPLSPQIQRICNIVMSRGIPPRPSNAACNALFWAVSDTPEDLNSIYSIGYSVRKALHRVRNPAFAAAYENVRGLFMIEHASNERCQDLRPPPGYMVVNSTWKFDWTSAHFGYPGHTRFFHTLHSDPRYIKIFQANPTRLPNGDWESHLGDTEIAFYLQDGADKAFQQTLREELKALGVEGSIDFLRS